VPATIEEGVHFPVLENGARSTSATGRAIVADAARRADPELADRVARVRDWRAGYVACVRDVTAACGGSAGGALAVAEGGLDALAARMVFVRDGRELPLPEAARAPVGAELGTVTVEGTGERAGELRVPYRGSELAGEALVAQLERWVTGGVVERSFADAIARVAAHPEWLALEGDCVALLGAGAEMGPFSALASWGADVVAVDVPGEARWERLLAVARAGAGRVTVVQEGGTPGVDVAARVPELRALLEAHAPEARLVLGTHLYADGAAHVEVSAAADALAADLLAHRPGTALAYLATPTDAFLVGPEVMDGAQARWRGRGRALRGLQAPLRTASRGRLFTPSYTSTVTGEDGRRRGVADALVPQQGPNYALAKRVQRWRGVVARAQGHAVSFNVAPASWTRSVTSNRILAAAYAGARRFGIEIFPAETSRVLMAAALVHDLRADAGAGADAGDHPEDLFARAAAHGGLWRSPYEPRSALGVAAISGAPRALRPG